MASSYNIEEAEESMSNKGHVTLQSIHELLQYFPKRLYNSSSTDKESTQMLENCIELFKRDYEVSLLNNENGSLSTNYPSQLIILDGKKKKYHFQYEEPVYGKHDLLTLVKNSHVGRCWKRFPVPVILYNDYYICRSSTLADWKEHILNGVRVFFNKGIGRVDLNEASKVEPAETGKTKPEPHGTSKVLLDESNKMETDDCDGLVVEDNLRQADIKLLKALKIEAIVDLMVETLKKKGNLKVSSSEKGESNRYIEFKQLRLPYPGCEFFKNYSDHNYDGANLVFDWKSVEDPKLTAPEEPVKSILSDIKWNDFRTWDLHTLTANYLKLILCHIQNNRESILIHCISGWDRTPLFISLIRLSLWADGVVHQSLNETEIMYLTIAYDWILFGHNLPDRLDKSEEVFFFCFNFLKHITGSKFSVLNTSRCASNVELTAHNEMYDKCSLGDFEISDDTLNSSDSPNSKKSKDSLSSQDDYVCKDKLDNTTSSSESQNISKPNSSPTTDNSNDNKDELNNITGHSPRSVNIGIPGRKASPRINRTPPVMVPGSRKRNESVNSVLSMGSWQVISESGSVRDSHEMNANEFDLNVSYEGDDEQIEELLKRRHTRLSNVRKHIKKIYSQEIGLKYKHGSFMSKFGSNRN